MWYYCNVYYVILNYMTWHTGLWYNVLNRDTPCRGFPWFLYVNVKYCILYVKHHNNSIYKYIEYVLQILSVVGRYYLQHTKSVTTKYLKAMQWCFEAKSWCNWVFCSSLVKTVGFLVKIFVYINTYYMTWHNQSLRPYTPLSLYFLNAAK